MQSWQSVMVKNEELQAHGRAGRVLSATPFKGTGKEKDVDFVEVKLDADGDRAEETATFAVADLAAL